MNSQSLFQGIDTVIVRVTDIDRSKQWYQEKLGFVIIYEDPDTRLVVLDTHSPTSLTLWLTDKKIANNSETSSYPIFKTADSKMARQALVAREVQVSELICDDAISYFQCYDPDGNVLEACQVH
jgi:catechol 2,3-dioxygenase-like lactoylglutathione lyase family enzyme